MLKIETNKSGVKKLSGITYKMGHNIWQKAAQVGILDMLQKTWEWVEKKPTTH